MEQLGLSCSNINWCAITISGFSGWCYCGVLPMLVQVFFNLQKYFSGQIFFRIGSPCHCQQSKYLVRSLKREMTQMVLIETTQYSCFFCVENHLKSIKLFWVPSKVTTRWQVSKVSKLTSEYKLNPSWAI